MKNTILEVNKIDVYYNDVPALHELSLSMVEGEIVCLLGSNGAGKSTTLKAIAGLLKPRHGEIVFGGVDLTTYPVHKIVELGISMVPEEKQVFGSMTVLENLELGAFVGRARKTKTDTLRFVYEVFPRLEARRGQKAAALSGGEQKMLLIGRALMSRPKLLLIDELSLGLAPILVESLFEVVTELNRSSGLAILLVEQNVRDALQVADAAFLIENGCITGQGKAAELLTDEKIRDTYFGLVSEKTED